MSNYRDDVNDTAVASDTLWVRTRTIAESTARVRDVLLFGLVALTVETAAASDGVTDKTTSFLTETAHVSEQYLHRAYKSDLLVEPGRASDAVAHSVRVLLQESAHAADELQAGVRTVLVERARGSDETTGQRYNKQTVQEHGKARDVLVVLQRTLVQDEARGAAAVIDRLRARTLVADAARVSDAVLDGAVARPVVLIERARANDVLTGTLRARDLVHDVPAVGWDELLSPGMLVGQAWTAETSGWAMSRYAPFAFTGLAVIDGVLYATGPDGVYALDGDQEEIDAQLRTGALDMTGGVLGCPVSAYLEYELSGAGAAASVAVTTTQSGTPITYDYPLDARPAADALTNARAVFGRGLRGRHFAYTLRLKGQRAYINDWSVLTAASKRSI